MLNEHDLKTWRDEMITVAQAKESLESMYDGMDAPTKVIHYHVINEFIKQYEDWVKVKKCSGGVLLKGKDE